MKLAGKVAFVTGAGGGLGLVFARALMDEGAEAVLTDINRDILNSAVGELTDYEERFSTEVLDVTSCSQVNDVMEKVYRRYGRIDILVNGAGGSLFTPKRLEEIKEEHWNKVLDVNLKGTFFCCQAAVKYMSKNKYGKIINVSSIGGRTASVVTGVPYAAAKGGVIALTRRLALEVGMMGINVNAVAPGTILDDSSYIHGAVIDVNGGRLMA